MIEIREITDKQLWEDFLLRQEHPPFLQSWNAGNLAQSLGREIWRLAVFDEKELVGVCLVEKTRARRGDYLYAPYGPVLREWKAEYLRALTDELVERGKKEGFDFVRIAPFIAKSDEHSSLFRGQGYRIAPIHMIGEDIWLLDLAPSEEDLLKQMRKTTRNLIRRAEKDGVVIRKSKDPNDIEVFTELMKETHTRHQFVPYPDELYRKQLEHFSDDDQAILFVGEYDGQPIASALVMYYGNAASYHHGASVRSKVPVAYLLQWEAIREAKRRGCKTYNFWGIVDTDDKKHPFYGITLFKKGFGGQLHHILPCQDYRISKRYYLTRAIETVRRIKRGFGWRRA